MADMTPIFRQWLLVKAIASGNGASTVKSLAELTGMSEKTVRRDLDVLREAGFPLAETIGEYGRKTFAIQTDDLPPLTFAYDEALALFFCRAALTPLSGTFFGQAAQQAFRKIRASLGPCVIEYVERMTPRIAHTRLGGDYSAQADLIDQLLLAIEDSKAAFITYRSERATEPITYDIHPYGLIEHRGSLYVVGFSTMHNAVRNWKIDRMLDAEVTKVPFQRPADFELEKYLAGSLGIYQGKEDVRVKVRFAPSVARYVSEKQMHASQRLTPQPDGGLLAEYRLSSTVELKSWLLSFGSQAEVLSPPELREEMVEEGRRLVQTYNIAHNSATMARLTDRQSFAAQSGKQSRKKAR